MPHPSDLNSNTCGCMAPSRRQVLGGIAAAGITSAASALPSPSPHRIDVHYHHIAPAWFREEAVRKALAPQVLDAVAGWTPDNALAEMDRSGIQTVVTSVSNPGIWFGDVAQARRLARACNDYAAALKQQHPGRFGSFAALPLPDVDGSLAEISHALDVLDADGIGLFTSYGDKWLADPAFAPVMQELNRRRAVIYVHPIAPSCCRQLMPGIASALLEYPFDTTRAITQWLLTRSTATYPDLRLIFTHGGALFMGGLGRFELLAESHPELKLPTDLRAQAAKLFYETSSSADPVAMRSLRSYVPLSQVLLGRTRRSSARCHPAWRSSKRYGCRRASSPQSSATTRSCSCRGSADPFARTLA